LSIIFPTFATKALIGHNDIYLGAAPVNTTSLLLDQDRITPTTSPLSSETRPSFCHHVIQFQDEVTSESKKVDNLLIQLCQYYHDVKMCQQLDLEFPASFRQQSVHQRQLHHHTTSTKTPSSSNDLAESTIDKFSSFSELSENSIFLPSSNDPVTNSSSQIPVPILRCVDKPFSSLPSRITFTEDFVRASVGFRRIDSIKANLQEIYQDTISFDTLPPDAVLDSGDFSSLQ